MLKFDLKEQFGFIANGQGAGNLVQNFESNGYRCIFVNSSTKDLDTIHARYKIHIPNIEGCAKDRNTAIEAMAKEGNVVLYEVIDKMYECPHIIVVTTTGGGTGSGITPSMVDAIANRFPDKNISIVAILPTLMENIQAQYNTLKFFQELGTVRNIKSLFILDNEKADKIQINNDFFDLFQSLLDTPNHKHILGNIDESEVLDMFKVTGCSIITKFENGNDVHNQILESWKHNIFATIEEDKILTEMYVSSVEGLNIESLRKIIGDYTVVHQGYHSTRTLTMLSGLSLPLKRLGQIGQMVQNNKNILQRRKSKMFNISINPDWLAEIDEVIEEVVEEKIANDFFDFSDIFGKHYHGKR